MAAIGILGGTFDPIHWGHLILAEQARETFSLDKVLFIPAASPPHKSGAAVSDASCRFEMVSLAIEGNEAFEASRIELDRPGISYTVDTVREIRASIGSECGLYLLVGADEARDFMSWRDPYKIQEMAGIVVANRPGVSEQDLCRALPKDFADRLIRLNMPSVDICSTDIRERAAEGRSIRYLTPDSVIYYIRSTGLYRGKP